MKEFIQHDLSDIKYQNRTNPNTLISGKSWSAYLRPRLYLTRAYKQLLLDLHLKKKESPKELPKDSLHDIDDEHSLAWQYTKHAILFMDSVARASQATFVIVPLVLLKKPYFDILQKFAGQHQIVFLERARVYDWDSSYFLPHDSHFNRAGADAMAELLSDFLRSR